MGRDPHYCGAVLSQGCAKERRKGYKDVVVHVSLLQVLYDGGLCDLGEQHHVIHTAMLDIVTLPVVAVGAFAALETKAQNGLG